MSITRDQLEGGKAYPVGNYELEIKDCEHSEGTSAKGKWERVILKTEIVTPDNLAGKKFTTSLFYDAMLGKLITIGLGKSLDSVFGSNKELDREKLFEVLRGQFVRVRLGITDRGYNQIAEILPAQEEIKI